MIKDVWELFEKAQHLHFANGDVLVLTTRSRVDSYDVARLRKELDVLSEGVRIMVVEPELEISKR